jgi:hypothetical protein
MAGGPNPITELDALSRAELGDRFEALYGRPAPKGMSRPFLLRIVAYRIQEDAAGGPNRGLRQRLARLAKELHATGTISSTPTPHIKPGTRFLREWRGETHTVTVTEGGFQYREKTYRSLSVIAREITGTRWSGPAFFGLKARKQQTETSHAG